MEKMVVFRCKDTDMRIDIEKRFVDIQESNYETIHGPKGPRTVGSGPLVDHVIISGRKYVFRRDGGMLVIDQYAFASIARICKVKAYEPKEGVTLDAYYGIYPASCGSDGADPVYIGTIPDDASEYTPNPDHINPDLDIPVKGYYTVPDDMYVKIRFG